MSGPTATESKKFNDLVAKAIAKADGVDLTPQWRTRWVAKYRIGPALQPLVSTTDVVAFKAAIQAFKANYPLMPLILHKVEKFK